jgi:hypothetical protein
MHSPPKRRTPTASQATFLTNRVQVSWESILSSHGPTGATGNGVQSGTAHNIADVTVLFVEGKLRGFGGVFARAPEILKFSVVARFSRFGGACACAYLDAGAAGAALSSARRKCQNRSRWPAPAWPRARALHTRVLRAGGKVRR